MSHEHCDLCWDEGYVVTPDGQLGEVEEPCPACEQRQGE